MCLNTVIITMQKRSGSHWFEQQYRNEKRDSGKLDFYSQAWSHCSIFLVIVTYWLCA